MKNIAVFASGRGSNFGAIAAAVKSGKIPARLALLVSDQPGAGVIAKALRLRVKAVIIRREDFASKDAFESAIIGVLKNNKIDLLALAGFMRMLGPKLLRAYRGRIMNIHPALLPSFKGSRAISDAFDYGVKLTGVTVHFVDELMDHGPVILQEAVRIEEKDTPRSLEEKIHRLEHRLYPEAISLFIKGKLKAKGRKVRISSR